MGRDFALDFPGKRQGSETEQQEAKRKNLV